MLFKWVVVFNVFLFLIKILFCVLIFVFIMIVVGVVKFNVYGYVMINIEILWINVSC